MFKVRAFFSVICVGFAALVTPISAQAAPVSQWADSAISEDYFDDYYTATEATGAPNAVECDGLNQMWATKHRNAIAPIYLTYGHPVVPTEIDVYQNAVQGAVSDVAVSDDGETWTSVYTGDTTQASAGTCDAAKNFDDILVVTVPSSVKTAITMVRVTVDQTTSFVTTSSWAEIDAVKLIGKAKRQAQQLPPVGTKLYKQSPILLPTGTFAPIAVEWAVTTPKVCKIKAGKLKAVGIGKCKVEVKNSGNDWYKPLKQKLTLTVKPGKAPKSHGQSGGN